MQLMTYLINPPKRIPCTLALDPIYPWRLKDGQFVRTRHIPTLVIGFGIHDHIFRIFPLLSLCFTLIGSGGPIITLPSIRREFGVV